MALAKISVEVELTEINCGQCGGTYAINEKYRETKYQKGGCWNCPYCRVGWGYSDNNENSKLKRALEQEKKRKEWAQQQAANAERALAAQKGVNTKLKKRVAAGVCPCCNRTFKQLSAHMAKKHPEFATHE
jgi:DNA repair exonuclease SbcCD ATPase subunit